jgi:hypothetical protein
LDLHLARRGGFWREIAMRHIIHALRTAAAAGLLLGWSPATAWAQPTGETFTATASLKTSAGAQVTAPVTIVVTRLTSEAQRTAVAEALKKGGTPAVVQSLKAMEDAGYIEIGQRRTAVKYAYVRPMGSGRLITVVAPTPIAYLGAGLPDAKPKAGFDLALVLLELNDGGTGDGELAPAATVKLTETGAVQTQDYGAETVRLTNVQAKK